MIKTLILCITLSIAACASSGDNFKEYLVKDIQYNIEGTLYTPFDYCEGDTVYHHQLKKQFVILKKLK